MGKILVLANFDVGLYKFRKELLQELMNRGNEVHIALPYGKLVDKLVDMGCIFYETPLERRGMNPYKDLSLFLHYRRLIKKINPDLVITYTIKPNIYGGLASLLSKTKYAVNITGLGSSFQRESLLKNIIVRCYRIALKKAKVVFFENEHNQQTFIDLGIIYKSRTCLLNGAGVNLEEYPYTPYPEDNGEIRFLFVGRIMHEKGVDELFEVAKRIRADHPNVYFDVVGPMEDNYTEVVNGLVKSNVINYYGYQEDVKPFIARSHCIVLPSHHEGMSNTLLEAGAMGRPLIASDIPGCKEAIPQSQKHMIVKPNSIDYIENAVRQFINLEIAFKKSSGIQFYTHIKCNFSRNQTINTTLNRIERVTVLNILNTSRFGGAESVVIKMKGSFNEKYHLLYCSQKGEINNFVGSDKVDVDKITMRDLRRVFENIMPDIIHAHDFTASIVSCMVAGKTPVVSHIHQSPRWLGRLNWKSISYRLFSDYFRKKIVVSDSVIEGSFFSGAFKDAIVLNNPIDIMKITNNYKYWPDASIDYDLAYIGRISPEKNPLAFINLIELLLLDIPYLKCVMVGDGIQLSTVRNEVKKRSLDKNIDILGFQENPFKFIYNSKALVMFSENEGFGLTIYESILLGRPVIMYRKLMSSLKLEDELIYPCDNTSDFLKHAKKVLNLERLHDPHTISRSVYNKMITPEVYVFMIERIYEEVL